MSYEKMYREEEERDDEKLQKINERTRERIKKQEINKVEKVIKMKSQKQLSGKNKLSGELE